MYSMSWNVFVAVMSESNLRKVVNYFDWVISLIDLLLKKQQTNEQTNKKASKFYAVRFYAVRFISRSFEC